MVSGSRENVTKLPACCATLVLAGRTESVKKARNADPHAKDLIMHMHIGL